MRTSVALCAVAGLLLLGCADTGSRQEATRGTIVTSSAVVDSVDLATRTVRLRGATGRETITVVAGPEVRNLAQVVPGDVVQIDYYDAITVSMADPSASGAVSEVIAGRAPEGARPGAAAAVLVDAVVTLVSYDPGTGLATYRTPSGEIRRTTVEPSLRTFAAARRPGDRILVSITEAVAVSITEAAA